MSDLPNNLSIPNAEKGSRIKNIALFFASPFIGLYYAILLPGKVFQIAMLELKSGSKK